MKPSKRSTTCGTVSLKPFRWIMAALFLIPSFGFSENAYWLQYGRKPVYVKQIDRRTNEVQVLKFVHFKGNRLFLELEVEGGGTAEISRPLSESMIKTLDLDIKEMEEANKMIFKEHYLGAAELLRPKVYPLIRFHRIPEMFSELHTPIRALISSLISAKNFSEAEDLLGRITLNQVDQKYSLLAIDLLNAYLARQDYEGATRVVNKLPVEDSYAKNVDYIIQVASILRSAGKHAAVIPLYRRVEKHVSGEVNAEIRMWLAYSLILIEQVDEAASIIEELQEPAPEEELFSLYKLLEGSREHYRGNYDRALDVLTRGFVRAQTAYTWVPEMLYLIGDCYAKNEHPTAARNVWTEVIVLYPDSLWAVNTAKSLEQLPPPSETEDTTTEASPI